MKKFQLFTHFLAGDHVKSLLSKEVRWLKNQKNEGINVYPFNRASAFAKELKKLSQTDSGNSGLDECRIILAEMGNIIAFVRMLRTAKRRVISDEMQYLPSLFFSASEKGKPSCEETNGEGQHSTRNKKLGIDQSISAILNRKDPDYVRAFVNVFKGVIQKSDNSFMSGFFSMVPSLCLCWMEAR